VIPRLPDMRLSDNSKRRRSYMQNAVLADKERREWGRDIWVLALEADPTQQWPQPPLRISWEIRWRDSKARDPDNIISCLKSVTDSLVDAGVIPGDSHTVVRELTIRSLMGHKSDWGTTLTIQGMR